MSATCSASFEHAIRTANIWLKAVPEALGIEDLRLANRVLCTWLPTLRDRFTVDVATHFGAQLPELLRGVSYDGWDPSIMPVEYGHEEHVSRSVEEAGGTAEEAPGIAPAVTAALRRHFSPGQLETAIEQPPHDVPALLLQPAS